MSKKQQFEIEINFIEGTTREDIEDILVMWHAEQIKKKIAEMPAYLAKQVISDINEMRKELHCNNSKV